MTEEIFELQIPREKLAATNAIWNSMKLNNPWVAGRVTSIIQQRDFASKEEWRDYYFKTGEERHRLLKQLSREDQARLTSVEIWNFYKGSSYKINQINELYGRTIEEINGIGDMMYGAIRLTDNPLSITRKECRYMAMYRLIGETWNGLVKRERNTIHTLSEALGREYLVVKTDGEVDIQYEVDAEVYRNGTLVAGVQIKPPSYKKQFENNQHTYDINKKKNDRYEKDFKAPVLYVYSDTRGIIENKQVIADLQDLADKKEKMHA